MSMLFLKVFLFLNIIFISSAHAGLEYSFFRKGVFITLAKPFPGIAGVGLNMTFSDFVRVHAEIETIMTLFSFGAQQYTVNGGAMFRVPFLRLTPVLSIDYSLQKISRQTRTWGKPRRDHYLIPGAGFEIGGKYVFGGILLHLIYQKYNGKWTSLHQVNDNNGPSKAYWASGYIGINII
jgi:hypothetical protein